MGNIPPSALPAAKQGSLSLASYISKCLGDVGAHRLPSPWREPGQQWCCGPPSAAARSPARAAPARPAATASAAAPAALGKAQPARGPGS